MWRSFRRRLNITPLRKLILNYRELYSRWMDWRWHVDTGGSRGEDRVKGRFADALVYEPIDYVLMKRFIALVKPTPQDIVYDIGSGAGRVLFFFSSLGVKECVGVELSAKLIGDFEKNQKRFRAGRCPIRTVHGDAAEADYGQGTIYWMYNPFGPGTLQLVLQQLHQSVLRHPRLIRIAYANPKHEQVLRDAGWLKCLGRDIPPLSDQGFSYWGNALDPPDPLTPVESTTLAASATSP